MSTPGQRETHYHGPEKRELAEAAARDFQRRGFRRRTRGALAKGDVGVLTTPDGFAVVWVPFDEPAVSQAAGTRKPRRRR